jgi:hypothetical protein
MLDLRLAEREEALATLEDASRGDCADAAASRPSPLGLGKLYHRTGKREQAREHIATATTMYREMGITYWLEQAEAATTKPGR